MGFQYEIVMLSCRKKNVALFDHHVIDLGKWQNRVTAQVSKLSGQANRSQTLESTNPRHNLPFPTKIQNIPISTTAKRPLPAKERCTVSSARRSSFLPCASTTSRGNAPIATSLSAFCNLLKNFSEGLLRPILLLQRFSVPTQHALFSLATSLSS